MMEVHLTPQFEKKYRKLPKNIKLKAIERENIFRKNPYTLSLKTHKLVGKEKEFWSFSVNYSYRIKFVFLSENEVLFLDIGTHEIYK